MSEFTVSGLSELLAIDRRTIKKRLVNVEPLRIDGKASYYDSRTVIAEIFNEKENPQHEKARLDRLRADMVEHDLQRKRGEVVVMSEIADDLERAAVEVKNKLLSVPTKATPLVIGQTKPPRIKAILEDLIHEALESLGNSGREILAGIDATTEADGEPVG